MDRITIVIIIKNLKKYFYAIFDRLRWNILTTFSGRNISVGSIKYQKLLKDLKANGMSLLEKFIIGMLIEKLLDSWKDLKNSLKHKKKNFTIEKIITHILIEYKEMALKET